ncbi:hypothetical protein MNV49_002978 [Pseudohyphozyma bogoriensis]|nr:hypothetical protein MNV49_002978 [Pseudohyphozyma bogoriensis]
MTSAASASSTTSSKGALVVEQAITHLGVKYSFGDESDADGFDCSGLTWACYSAIDVTIPRVASDQAASPKGTTVSSVSKAKAGDLVFFGDPVTHVGVYQAKETIIHAPHTGTVVRRAEIWEEPSYIKRFV